MNKSLDFLIKLLVFTILYLGVFYYPLQRILILTDQRYNLSLQIIAYLLLLLPIIGMLLKRLKKTMTTKIISSLSMLWLGYSFILFLIVLIFELINLFITVDFELLGVSLFLISLFLTIYGTYNAFTIHPKHIYLNSSKISKNYKFAQITDVHIGSRTHFFLEQVVRKIKTLNLDFLVITGDLIDIKGVTKEQLSSLSTLNIPIFYVSGNHERYAELENIYENLKANNIEVLVNEKKQFNEIQIIGIEDQNDRDTLEKVLSKIKKDDEKFTLLLYHKPEGFEYCVKRKIDLKLAGHTHNGQIFPFNYLVKLEFKQIQGLFEKNGFYSYVSPGTGTWGPTIRIGSKNEISVFHLVAKQH